MTPSRTVRKADPVITIEYQDASRRESDELSFPILAIEEEEDFCRPSHRALISEVCKSQLVDRSDFFRAMFSHDCVENRTNKVILHDDNKLALERVFEFLEEPDVSKWPAGKWWEEQWDYEYPDVEEEHCIESYDKVKELVEELKVADKYSIDLYKPTLWEPIAFYLNKMTHGRVIDDEKTGYTGWSMMDLLKLGQDLVLYNGWFPTQLIGAFASSWEALSTEYPEPSGWEAFFEANPRFCLALARHFKARVFEGRKAMNKAKTVVDKCLEL